MCEHCDKFDRTIEVTEETAPYMVSETSIAALHSATHYANGWFKAAKGLFIDMQDKWGGAAVFRMSYVWASAFYYLPRPEDAPPMDTGYSEVMQKMTAIGGGQAPDAAHVAHVVVTGDQAHALVKEMAEAASKGDMPGFAKLLEGIGDGDLWNAVMAMLMTEAGFRVRHARDQDDERAMELFMSHVNADMPEADDDEEEGGAAGETAD